MKLQVWSITFESLLQHVNSQQNFHDASALLGRLHLRFWFTFVIKVRTRRTFRCHYAALQFDSPTVREQERAVQIDCQPNRSIPLPTF